MTTAMMSASAPKATKPGQLPEFGRIYRRHDGGLFRMVGVSYYAALDQWLVTYTDQRTGDALSERYEDFLRMARWPDGKDRPRHVLLAALPRVGACHG